MEPTARSGGERYELVVELTPHALEDGYVAELDDGTRVSAETFRRVACDCALSAVVTDEEGELRASGKRTRVVSASLRRAMRRRDRGMCAFPGCTNHRWVDAHHIEHWAHGGKTSLENLISVCQAHHRLVHEGGFDVERDAVTGGVVFETPSGERIESAPRGVRVTRDPRDAWRDEPGAAEIDARTGLTRWDGSPVDYRACVDALIGASSGGDAGARGEPGEPRAP